MYDEKFEKISNNMNNNIDSPLVSVILATFNEPEDIINQSIRSILDQTLINLELLIIDDSTNPETVNKINEFTLDARVIIIREADRIGFVKSLNVGIERAKGKYIARMDGDDIAYPTRLEKQAQFLDNHIEIDCLGTFAVEFDEKGDDYFKKRMPITHEECFSFFKKRDCMIHPSVMYRRTYFEKAGLYPEDAIMDEDSMMWALGFKNGCIFANLPEYLLKFRINSDFFNRRGGWERSKWYFMLRRKINKMLNYGPSANIYAFLYAIAKMMPRSILNLIYKTLR